LTQTTVSDGQRERACASDANSPAPVGVGDELYVEGVGEGFDTLDLQEAKTLLDELRACER